MHLITSLVYKKFVLALRNHSSLFYFLSSRLLHFLLPLQLDRAEDPEAIRIEAAHRGNVACISALTGEGMDEFYEAVERKIKVLWLHQSR